MQQLTIEHKNKIENKKKDRREGKGRVLAISRNVYHLLNSDAVYYVESESSDDNYYFVKFKPDGFSFCNCKDNSIRGLKCKHLFTLEFAIKWGTIKEIDKVSDLTLEDVKLDTTVITKQQKLGQPNLQSYKLGQTNLPSDKLCQTNNNNETLHKLTNSYLDDDYDF
jgi:hypothetical protein